MRYELRVAILATMLLCLMAGVGAASNERLIAGEKEFSCNKEANGALKIIDEVRSGIPQAEWYAIYPIPEDYPPSIRGIIEQAVADAYGFKGDHTEFMRKIYKECMGRI